MHTCKHPLRWTHSLLWDRVPQGKAWGKLRPITSDNVCLARISVHTQHQMVPKFRKYNIPVVQSTLALICESEASCRNFIAVGRKLFLHSVSACPLRCSIQFFICIMARLRMGVIVMYAGMFVYVVLYSVYCRLFLFWQMFLLFDMEMNASYISQNRASLRQFVTVF